MKFNVYGRKIEIVCQEGRWAVFYLGEDGKKRTAHDIVIPPELAGNEIKNYLEDILHECATSAKSKIVKS